MVESKTKITIVEDHKLFREGLKSMLADKASLEVIGEAGDEIYKLELTRSQLTPKREGKTSSISK